MIPQQDQTIPGSVVSLPPLHWADALEKVLVQFCTSMFLHIAGYQLASGIQAIIILAEEHIDQRLFHNDVLLLVG